MGLLEPVPALPGEGSMSGQEAREEVEGEQRLDQQRPDQSGIQPCLTSLEH